MKTAYTYEELTSVIDKARPSPMTSPSDQWASRATNAHLDFLKTILDYSFKLDERNKPMIGIENIIAERLRAIVAEALEKLELM